MKSLKILLVLLLSLSLTGSVYAAPECDGQFYYKIEGVEPFANAFPASIKTGALNTRMNDFVTRWPDNVKKVQRVKMKADLGNNHRPIREQDFFVISLDGLNQTKKQEIMADYLESIAENTMSFPLGNSAGHLYTRVGTKTIDNLWGVSTKEYRVPDSDRLETVLSLNNAEMEKLKWYAHHANANSQEVVGGWNYEGTKETVGKINNNKCSTNSGHNCTSWMSLAPIGENGETLKQMVGAVGFDMGRNPGWMTSYIHAYTQKSRFPFVVFMSNKPMTQLDEMIQSGKVLEWDYSLH